MIPAGCSKRPDFSPAQPWRAETRLVPGKAAASEEARRTLRYVEPLSDARTPLADFFSILLISTLRLHRGRCQIPIETMKLFRRQIFILKPGESGLIDGIFDRVVVVRRCDCHKSRRKESLRQQDTYTQIVFQRQPNDFSRLVSRNFSAQTDVLRRLPLSEKLEVDIRHPRLGKLICQCGHLILVLARQYDFDTTDQGRRYDFGSDDVSRHHTGTHSNHHMEVSRKHHGYFALKLKPNDVEPFAATVTLCSFSPRVGCQALIRYVPAGRSLISKLPSRSVIA